VRKADNLTTILGHSRPVTGLLYPYLYHGDINISFVRLNLVFNKTYRKSDSTDICNRYKALFSFGLSSN